MSVTMNSSSTIHKLFMYKYEGLVNHVLEFGRVDVHLFDNAMLNGEASECDRKSRPKWLAL